MRKRTRISGTLLLRATDFIVTTHKFPEQINQNEYIQQRKREG